LKHVRAYRALRVAIAFTLVFPRYLALVLRERLRWPAGQAAWDRAHAAAAGQLRRLALSLEGGFVKAAQVAGARADVLPAPFIEKLSQFHDAVPPRRFAALRAIVERDLGAPVESVFQRFDAEALAAASLAQVHRARLRDGREVAVKIQYPEIRRIIPLDLGMLRAVVGSLRLLQSRLDLRSVVAEVTRFIELELDFRREVEATERLAEILAERPEVRVPAVVREHCGDHVIVLEYLEGIQVTRIAAFEAAGHKRAEVARKIGALYGAMIFELGFFHGDPHPGNLLVLADGRIGLLDFGLCKELPEGFARNVAQMMVCALIGDAPAALAAAEQLGFDTSAIRPEHLRSLLLIVVGDSDGEAGVVDILQESRIRRIPEHFALVLRTLILLNGLSHRLAPGRRLVQGELLKRLAAGATAGEPPRGGALPASRPAPNESRPAASP
jgi:ubiquinone biosynthesis protein